MDKTLLISKEYKIIFFFLVHESIECVEDLVQNIHAVCPNSAALIHVNSNSSDEFYNNVKKIASFYDFCYILPNRLPSDWDSGLQLEVYFEMMQFSIDNFKFSHVYLTASNSLLVNPNLENIVDGTDIFSYKPGPMSDFGGWTKPIMADKNLWEYVSKNNNQVHLNICEGVCMNEKVIRLYQNELLEFLNYKHVGYPSVEFWLASALVNFKEPFSQIHKNLEKWVHCTDDNIHKLGLPVDCVGDYIFNFIIEKKFTLMNELWIYSLKRIPRSYDDPHRRLIRSTFNYHNCLF